MHEIESAVYSAREGAGWTGLGRTIPPRIAKDPAKIATLCGADWHVIGRPAFYKDDSGEFHRVPDTQVQVRSDTGYALSVTSETRYHTKFRQPTDTIEAFRDELAAERLEISHAAVLRGGKIIVCCALLPDEFDMVIGKSDRVKRYVTLSTGYDLKNGTKATDGDIRVVCANTLAMSLSQFRNKETIRASTKLEEGTLKRLIVDVQEGQVKHKAFFDGLANAKMSKLDVAKFFGDVLEINIENLDKKDAQGKDLISAKARAQFQTLALAYANAPGAVPGSKWGALNAVTYYATHQKIVRDTCDDGAAAARVASNMFGDAARLKARALQLLAA